MAATLHPESWSLRPELHWHLTAYETGALLHSLEGRHTIVVIEHDMTFVRQLARKVTVLHQGTMLCEGSVDEVQNNERVIEVYLGRKKKDKH